MHDNAIRDETFPVSITNRERVFTGAVWDVQAETFIYRSGDQEQTLRREYIKHPGAVAIAVLNDHNELLLLQQYRHPVTQKLWEIPAGLLDDPNESMLQTAQRELAEEADLVARSWATLVDFYTTPGSSQEGIRIYVARELEDVPEDQRHQRNGEEIDMAQTWVSIEQAKQLVFSGQLHNPSTVLAILALAAGGLDQLRPEDDKWFPAGLSGRTA